MTGAPLTRSDPDEPGAPPASPAGVLVLAASPIGDPADASPRLRAELARADTVAAEDTRRLRRLLRALDLAIPGRVVSYYDANEAVRAAELVERLLAGERVLVITDAGMPGVSDPGYRVVVAAIAAGVTVTAVPGPSAVLTALAISGLPVDRFCFEGFLPRRPSERQRRLRDLAGEPRTLVFFEAPHRLEAMLAAMADVLGQDRPAAVCRELTKTYEEVRRGALAELAIWAADGVRGEITVVVAGAPAQEGGQLTAEDLAERVRVREEAGEPRKDAIAAVAAATGRPKRDVFDAVVAAKRSSS